MINSRSDARQAVQFCRYPPVGVRGFAPIRASRYLENLSEYISEANSAVSLIVQIETPEAAANIDEILTTEGLNGIFIGPSDMASFMGFPAQTGHPKVVEAIDGIASHARAHSIPFGLPTWSEEECLSFVRKRRPIAHRRQRPALQLSTAARKEAIRSASIVEGTSRQRVDVHQLAEVRVIPLPLVAARKNAY